MKFLILQKVKHVSVEAWAKVLPAHFMYLDNLEKEGKIETSYHLIGRQGNMLVVNVKSDEELTRIIGEDPLFFYSEREVYPLTTHEVHKKHLRQLLKP